MKNRAKCKLCESIIESFHSTDYVSCKCGEISVDGGDAFRCAAKNWNNFLRIDNNGNEIVVKVKEEHEMPLVKPTKKELLNMLEDQIKAFDNLPPHAMNNFVTHYDLYAALLLLSSILKEDLEA